MENQGHLNNPKYLQTHQDTVSLEISSWWKEICICHPPSIMIITYEDRDPITIGDRSGTCPGCHKTWDEHILNNKLVDEKYKNTTF